MNIVIYAIAKNEMNFVQRFMDTTIDADEVYVLDTGSTDGTVDYLRELGAHVKEIKYEPFRFDEARNDLLNMIPDDVDVCVSLDLDETLEPGWREEIERVWTADTKQLRYNYVWSHKADGSPDVHFLYEKIHARHGFKWVYPVHEVLSPDDAPKIDANLTVHHYPDLNKPRSSYLGLLKLSVEEEPYNDRHVHYLGREYMFNGNYIEAIKWFSKHITMETSSWAPERSASYRYMAHCYQQTGNLALEEVSLLRACSEAPGEREPWIDHSKYCVRTHQWAGGLYSAQRALAIEEKSNHYICDGYAWGEGPYDLMSVCFYYLGLQEQAINAVITALELAPYSKRIQSNHALMIGGSP
jgi:glycosyltransferase involved in cell wall biosynthesis